MLQWPTVVNFSVIWSLLESWFIGDHITYSFYILVYFACRVSICLFGFLCWNSYMLLCWLTLKSTADCCIPIFHIKNLCLFSSHIVVNIMKFYTTALQVIGFAKFTKTVQSISFCIRKCLYLVWRTYFFLFCHLLKDFPF